MKPIFISNNKMFYSAMLIICLGIIVVGINYNKKQSSNLKSTGEKMQNVISVSKTVEAKAKSNDKNKKAIMKSSPKQVNKKISEKSSSQNLSSRASQEKFFEEYKMERDRTRDREIELLREIINNPQSNKQTRTEAQNKLFIITQNLEKEMDIENILKANDFNNSVVFLHKSGVTVIIQNLNSNNIKLEKDKDKIYEIVSLVTDFKKENIEIIFKK